MSPHATANLFDSLPEASEAEVFETLAAGRGTLVRRIVSTGQSTPPGQWFLQHHDEWVTVLAGAAGLRIDGEGSVRTLAPGDHLLIPAGARHRVEWTAENRQTVWLAVHFG